MVRFYGDQSVVLVGDYEPVFLTEYHIRGEKWDFEFLYYNNRFASSESFEEVSFSNGIIYLKQINPNAWYDTLDQLIAPHVVHQDANDAFLEYLARV